MTNGPGGPVPGSGTAGQAPQDWPPPFPQDATLEMTGYPPASGYPAGPGPGAWYQSAPGYQQEPGYQPGRGYTGAGHPPGPGYQQEPGHQPGREYTGAGYQQEPGRGYTGAGYQQEPGRGYTGTGYQPGPGYPGQLPGQLYAPAGWPARPDGYPPALPGQPASNPLAITSLVVGITSIVFCWLGLLTLAQVVIAIVFGVKGMNRAEQGAGGKGLATAGLVCGCVGAACYLFVGFSTLGVGFIV